MTEEQGLPFGEKYIPAIKQLMEIRRESLDNLEKFWDEKARALIWFKYWDKVLDDSNPPFYRWFVGGVTNITVNALDRWMNTEVKSKVAYYWEGEPGDTRVISYYELWREVNRFAQVLKNLGVKPDDRVVIYMPMIPELPIAMLAAARIGAIHSVVFSGFSPKALADRIVDAKAKVLITADGYYRRGKVINLKKNADEGVKLAEEQGVKVEKVLVVKRSGLNLDVNMVEGRDYWYDELAKEVPHNVYVPPEPRKSDDVLFILYSSGTTGKPKGIMHSVGGYMVWVYWSFKWTWDPRPDDVMWTAADIGWITGHTYIVYAPLMHGMTNVMYEGAPDYPQPDRVWEIIEKYRVTILYTSPTAIRLFRKYGDEWVKKHDLSSLRLLGTVGEPINPDVWKWYYEVVGGGKLPIVDTWWQTETGAAMIAPAPGIALVPLKPGSATYPLPGVDADVFNDKGEPAKPGEKGYLVIKKPWPGMLMGLWGDPQRYIRTYWQRFSQPDKGIWIYYPADYAVKDEDGYIWMLGRADEVLNVAGHRLGTTEIEDAILTHPAVAEAAVVGIPDPIKGEVPLAVVVLREGYKPSKELEEEIKQSVRKALSPIAVPSRVLFVNKLPKTRSGKIMRRLVKAVATGAPLGDVSTLEDEASVEEIKKAWEEFKKAVEESERLLRESS
ncbi:acetyl-coenzyme A synthetase [Pyrodictium occultum]|uniref:Acetate--CoA ligase n=1 Tax=Pyrodictium occultum TaxID=2309 RepID=A0A0V8RUD3_PYROC|nr:acetate--CoA ligase [Pyrodictium occultum]KSW11603.1 acetyl-coenzyme A synthetase [Pyrodictium occultum]